MKSTSEEKCMFEKNLPEELALDRKKIAYLMIDAAGRLDTVKHFNELLTTKIVNSSTEHRIWTPYEDRVQLLGVLLETSLIMTSIANIIRDLSLVLGEMSESYISEYKKHELIKKYINIVNGLVNLLNYKSIVPYTQF